MPLCARHHAAAALDAEITAYYATLSAEEAAMVIPCSTNLSATPLGPPLSSTRVHELERAILRALEIVLG